MLNPDSKSYKWIVFLLLLVAMVLIFFIQNYLSAYPFYPHQVCSGLLFGILVAGLIYWNQSGKIRSLVAVKAKRKFNLRNNWLAVFWILICCSYLIMGKPSHGFIYSAFLVFWLFQLVWSFFVRGVYFSDNKIYSFSIGFYSLRANTVSAAAESPEGFEFFYNSIRGSAKLRKDDYDESDWEKVVYLMKEWCVRNEVVMR